MDQQTIIILGILVVVALVVLAWKFDAIKISVKHDGSEGSLEANQHAPAAPVKDDGPATGAVKVSGSTKNTTVETNVSGAADAGAGSVEVGKDVEGGSIKTNVNQPRDDG